MEKQNKNRVSIQLYEVTTGRLYSLKKSPEESLDNVINSLIDFRDAAMRGNSHKIVENNITVCETNTNKVSQSPIPQKSEVKRQYKETAYRGNHNMICLGEEISADTYGEVFAKFIDWGCDNFGSEFAEKLIDEPISNKRGTVGKVNTDLYRQGNEKGIIKTKHGYLVISNVGERDTIVRVKKACDVHGLKYGEDIVVNFKPKASD